jgi:serine/threonine protein kinase/Tol biopolymer transport system component
MTDLASLQVALEGRYTIERELGAGGMATVFLAEDVRHHRNVAVKVLRPELAAVIGAERFLAEIETTANLQHPHILPLFDSGEVDGTVFYVMPYIKGESLRDRLDSEKQLPIDDAVRLTSEIASALDYAHRHDVIHRDIKPENILLHEGQAMVADFGIALAASSAGSTRMTETGMSLGTPHYMSPEQAMGEREITARSDVYALGVMLYEMLVGEPPFNGPTAQAIVAQVVTESPRPLTARRGTVPVNVEAATLAALEKLPADRFASAADFASALANPSFTGARTPVPLVAAAVSGRWKRLAIGLAGVSAAMLLVAVWALGNRDASASSTEPSYHHIRLTSRPLVSGDQPMVSGELPRELALAPDGSAMVFVDSLGGDRLWLKERNEQEPVALAGTEGGFAPFFSPDGRWIAFSSAGRLLKVPRLGGSAVTVSDSGGSAAPGVWLKDGTIAFVGGTVDRQGSRGEILFIVSDTGGPQQRLANSDDLERSFSRIAAIPGRRALLVSGCPNYVCARSEVMALDIETGAVRPLVEQAAGAWYVPPGILVYSRLDGGVFATPFDLATLTTFGAAVPVMTGAQTGEGLTDIVVGTDGTMIYVAGQSNITTAESQVVWVDRSGHVTVPDSNWTAEFANNSGPSLSPDGTRLVVGLVEEATGINHLYIKRLPDGPLSRLTFDESQHIRHSWSPDGRDILYVSDVSGKMELWRMQVDGGGQATKLVEEARPVFEGRLSPDGEWVVFRTDDLAAGRGDIYARRLSGDTATVTLVATPYEETSPMVSPNGRWLAYTSNETGRKEVYVRPFPNARDGLWQVSIDGGIEPTWSQDGTELWYRTLAGDVLVAQVETAGSFQVGERRRLFRMAGALLNDDSHYFDVRADGQRVLIVRPVGTDAAQSGSDLVLIENWFTVVRAAVAAANQ